MPLERSVSIVGSGSAVPSSVITSEEVRQRFGEAAERGAQASGVIRRYYVGSETQLDLAHVAATRALASASLLPADIDLVLSASAVPYQTLPAMAPMIMGRLGIEDGQAAAFDINSTCLSFLNALEVATRMIGAGQAQSVLIVSAEVASRALPWHSDPATAALFGDGAAAVVVQASNRMGGLCAAKMRTFPSGYDACSIKAGGTAIDFHNDPEAFAQNAWFAMDGKDLFRLSARHFKGFVDEVLAAANWTIDDVDWVVPHQASPGGLAHMIRMTGLPKNKTINICAKFGNQIAASLPFTLDHAVQSGQIVNGNKVLFLGTSAGVSFGGVAWQM